MHSELDARYRDAVRDRTSRVAKLGKDQVGYLHLPDMERTGYSEFWRHFPREVKKGALIVDLRGNAGGHISELLLAKLAQRPLAWDVPRRGAAATARSIHTGSHTTPLAS
jgi:C-terminal processing protease CtpA/Prc